MDWQSLDRMPRGGAPPALVELLVQQIPWGVLMIDARSGAVVLANAEMQRILAAPGLGSPGATTFQWRGRRRDGREYRPGDWPHERALTGVPVTDPEDVEIVRLDGGRACVRITAVPIAGDDRPVAAVLVTCVDRPSRHEPVDARRFLAEANGIFASSPDHRATLRRLARLAVPTLADWCTIDLLDADGGVERVAVEHVDPRRTRLAAELSRRHPPPPDTGRSIAESARGGRPQLIEEVTSAHLDELAQGDAHRRFLEELGLRSLIVVPLVAGGVTIGAIALASAESGRHYDTGDLELAEELASRAALAIENARLLDQSRAATAAKSDFLAVMSHELRTPLTAIIGYSELLQLGVPEPVTPGQREQAERIEASARQLLQLVEEILGLATLGSGKDRTHDHRIHLNELLGRAAGIVEPMARAKGIALRVGFADGDATVESDPDKLLQVILSFLSNAVKFTEKGEIELAGRRSGATVTFEVIDTGIGVDPADRARIFEPFWQVERPITRRAGGTGLGLAIARRLVDLLGGEIEMESALGQGSTFRVSIPAERAGPGRAPREGALDGTNG